MLIFKIIHAGEWREAERVGEYVGSDKDRADGFLHFSTAEQLEETLKLHYATYTDGLVLVAVVDSDLGGALKWERSRGGQLFPHLYSPLSRTAVNSTLFTHYRSLVETNFAALRLFLSEIS